MTPFNPSALRHGPVGRAAARLAEPISEPIQSSVELSGPLVVHGHGQLPICSIWACPRAKNLSNLPQIGSRVCGSHISETAGWMYPI